MLDGGRGTLAAVTVLVLGLPGRGTLAVDVEAVERGGGKGYITLGGVGATAYAGCANDFRLSGGVVRESIEEEDICDATAASSSDSDEVSLVRAERLYLLALALDGGGITTGVGVCCGVLPAGGA